MRMHVQVGARQMSGAHVTLELVSEEWLAFAERLHPEAGALHHQIGLLVIPRAIEVDDQRQRVLAVDQKWDSRRLLGVDREALPRGVALWRGLHNEVRTCRTKHSV